MGENSKIEWTDHTWNPWVGCTKVSAGCANCYAETLMDKRLKQVHWGKGQPRKRTSEKNWKLVEKWNREAQAEGVRRNVFCASLADVFDPEVPIEWLADAFDLIRRCAWLNFLMLTKRPELFGKRILEATEYMDSLAPLDEVNVPLPSDGPMADTALMLEHWRLDDKAPSNVWIGTSVEDGPNKKRIDDLRKIPAKVRFLSCEPLLADLWYIDLRNGIDWVIAGGESGPNARPMNPDWARDLRDRCVAAGVPFFFKQWGEWTPGENVDATKGVVQTAKLFGGEWDFSTESLAWNEGRWDDQPDLYRVGKKAAGRLLDGREWNEFPEVIS